jgi:hypothetical protein
MTDQSTNTRELLLREIHKLPPEDQVKLAVFMGPAKLSIDAVNDLGGVVSFTKQLMSHDPKEGEKAFETMSQFVKDLATLADTDTLKKIAGNLLAKAEKAVAERDAYGISMVAIAAIGDLMSGRTLAKMNKIGDLDTHGGGSDVPNVTTKVQNEKIDITNSTDYLGHRDEIVSDGRYQWHPIDSNKTLDDVPDLLKHAQWELEEVYGHERSLFDARPPTPDYLIGKNIPKSLADKEALLMAGHDDIIDTLKLIRASKSVPNGPRGPESTLFLHKVGAPPVVITSEITDHLFWARIMDDHIERTMTALEDKTFYSAEQMLSSNKKPFKKEPAHINDAQDLSLAEKFYTKFANDAYLAQYGNPGDTLLRYKITPNLLTESGAQSVLGISSADGSVKLLLATEEMYGGKIPHVGDYKKTTPEQAYQLTYRTENHVLNTPITEFFTNIANSAYLAKHGKSGDSITRIPLQNFNEKGNNESLLLIKSTDGSQKLVHASNELSNQSVRYEPVSKERADIFLNKYVANNEAYISNAKQTISSVLEPDVENNFHNNGQER